MADVAEHSSSPVVTSTMPIWSRMLTRNAATTPRAPVNAFQFGDQTITTRVHMMVPRKLASAAPHVDVTAAMEERPRSRAVSLKVLADADPFAAVEV